jgi:hypothetical protein
MTFSTAICIANGPSLTKKDVDFCRHRGRVYAVSDAYRLAPWADVIYSADCSWWRHHPSALDLPAEKWTCSRETAQEFTKLNYIPHLPRQETWSNNQSHIASGGNSGHQALNLAVLHGAQRVILLGYDMQRGTGGIGHWFGEHPWLSQPRSNFAEWIKNLRLAAPQIPVPVINCTRSTALDAFPLAQLEDVL